MTATAYVIGLVAGAGITITALAISPPLLEWVEKFHAWVMEEESE